MYYKVAEFLEEIPEDVDVIYSDEDYTWFHELSNGEMIECGFEVVIYFKDGSKYEIDPVKYIGIDDEFVYIDNSYSAQRIPRVVKLDLRKRGVVEDKEVAGVYDYKSDFVRTLWKRER